MTISEFEEAANHTFVIMECFHELPARDVPYCYSSVCHAGYQQRRIVRKGQTLDWPTAVSEAPQIRK
jgi:hypothetical protein